MLINTGLGCPPSMGALLNGLGATEYTPAQLVVEQGKWEVMNANRISVGLDPLPMPADLTPEDVFVQAGTLTKATGTVRTTREYLSEVGAGLRRIVGYTPEPAEHDEDDDEMVFPNGGAAGDGYVSPEDAARAAEQERLMAQPTKKKSIMPYVIGGGALVAAWYMFGRKKKAS